MIDMGYPLHSIDLMAKLYRKLSNILAEMMMRETIYGFQGGLH